MQKNDLEAEFKTPLSSPPLPDGQYRIKAGSKVNYRGDARDEDLANDHTDFILGKVQMQFSVGPMQRDEYLANDHTDCILGEEWQGRCQVYEKASQKIQRQSIV